MTVKSFGNPSASFRNRFGRTGTKASKPYNAISATGGNTIYTFNGKKVHVFTGTGDFTVSGGSLNVEVFVVAGGGGAGVEETGGNSISSGGGGAGGVAYNPSVTVNPGPNTITVGGGAPARPAPGNEGFNGNDTTAFGITAKGGGGGGSSSWNGKTGGSGGGGGRNCPGSAAQPGPASQPSQPQPAGTTNFGTIGGAGSGSCPDGNGGGGGGGAGVAGSPHPGAGGGGTQAPSTFRDPTNPFGTPGPNSGGFYFGGGGAGGRSTSGGYGGGGSPPGSSKIGANGTTNTGGGGGGNLVSAPDGTTGIGGGGGSGIVLIAYPS